MLHQIRVWAESIFGSEYRSCGLNGSSNFHGTNCTVGKPVCLIDRQFCLLLWCCCFWCYCVDDGLWDANSLFSSIWFESSIQTALPVHSGPKPCRLFGEKLEQNSILLLWTNMRNTLRSTGVITSLRSYACMPSMRSFWCSVYIYNIYYEKKKKKNAHHILGQAGTQRMTWCVTALFQSVSL